MRQSVQLTMRPKAELLIDTIDALSEVDKHYLSMIQTVESTANSRFHLRLLTSVDKSLIKVLTTVV